MSYVRFDVSKADGQIIKAIVERAAAVYAEQYRGEQLDKLAMTMDITAVHANGCPLRLQDLLEADAFNFAHDVGGISRHIDRRTGQLGGMFRPRYCVRTVAA